MDDDSYWRLVAEQRRELADFLSGLSPEQWETPSLCPAWRVRDVAAHLALTPQLSLGPMLRAAVRAGGNPHRVAAATAIRHARKPTERIVQEIRDHAEDRGLRWPLDGRNVLFDLLVHTQDMVRPLGMERPMPVVGAQAALDRVWEMGWPFRASRRLSGVRLRATDSDWAAGDGPEVAGRTEDLLLLATGRTAVASERLSGPGMGALVCGP
jgi:uncharacterized protein (TIGR03083 family)